jgi:hypothetical protein
MFSKSLLQCLKINKRISKIKFVTIPQFNKADTIYFFFISAQGAENTIQNSR